MSASEKNNAGAPLISRASALLRKCIGFLEDQERASTGWEVFYAIDTDVVRLYLDPADRQEYVRVFSEDATTAQSLAFLLGDFLFQPSTATPLLSGQGNQKTRFLLIPPHDDELLRMLAAMYREIGSIAGNVNAETFEILTKLFCSYESNRDDQILLEGLKDNVPDLVELFNPYRGPKAALERFARIPENALMHIASYHDHGFVFPLLDPINDKADRERADQLIAAWMERLMLHTSRAKPAYRVRHDAEALATLEHVNSMLRAKKKKVVLVTGSESLFSAADEYRLSDEGSQTFSDRYLRHPQAFLAHPEFFAHPPAMEDDSSGSSQSVQFNLIDWLNLFFPTALLQHFPSSYDAKRNVLRTLEARAHDPRFVKTIDLFLRIDKKTQPDANLLDGWKNQVATTAQARYADGLEKAETRGARALADVLDSLHQNQNWSLGDLQDLIFEESLGSISRLYFLTVSVGLWMGAEREQSKGIPALRFDEEYKVVEEYCDAVIKLQLASAEHQRDSTEPSMPDERLEEIKRLNEAVTKVDKSLYHAHVVHALAFATKGHWDQVLTLSQIAMTISDRLPQVEHEVRRGREAAYLACIACRRSANDKEGLDKAERYLDEAIGVRQNKGAGEDVRFIAEKLAIATRRHYFDYFCGSRSDVDFSHFQKTLDRLKNNIETANNEGDIAIKRWVLRQSLTNYFTLLLILRDAKHGYLGLDEKYICQSLDSLERIIQPDSNKSDDPYALLVFHVALSIWGSDPGRQEEAKISAFREAEYRLKSKHLGVMPYDSERTKMLQKLIPARRTI